MWKRGKNADKPFRGDAEREGERAIHFTVDCVFHVCCLFSEKVRGSDNKTWVYVKWPLPETGRGHFCGHIKRSFL